MLQTEPETPPGSNGAPIEPGADRAERLLAELNGPQGEAVRHGEGPLLVLAGAGSGKTRVLTHRIAYLLATGAARPGEILAITFTNKAASEMRERVEALVGRPARGMWVTTFHSACARMLRADAERLGYSRGFTIYDESDSLRMLKRCMAELGIDPKRFPPRAIRAQISGAKNELVDPAAFAQAQGSVFEETAAAVYELYEKRMLEANAMDFDDLLVRMVNVLETSEEARDRWRRAFRHVLVDEYQDTNHAQYRLLQLLTSEHGNLMVVGDEDQSIYGFRHADIRNILDFERDFPDAEVVKLEQNYRSTQTILSAANAVVERNRERRPKHLWTEVAGGEPIQLSELADEHEEARWVAGEIERLAEEGVRREDVAVFYRTNAMSRVLEDTLVRFELPYQVIGGTKFYERAEVKDAVAYLSLLVNPADQVSFARVVNSPRRGIGNTSQGRLASHANTTGLPIWQVAGRAEEVPGLSGAAIKAVTRFHETMEGLRARVDDAPVSGLLEAILRETGYLDALAAERTVEAEGRIENLEELVGVAAEFDANREVEGEGEAPPLEEFLQQISLYTEQDGLREEESLITLMTLHNAKGLEYDTVFIVGCEDGAFPHMRALEEGGEEEERRLCYVGITRARRRLYLTWARERRLFGRAERNLPSRFIDELPAELTERHSSAPGAAAGLGWETSPEGLAAPIEPGAALELRTGDDIVHASFGDGVITAVEPGGIVVVRFSGDGVERKLMADYAPIRRR
ncbi:MAG TPA: UvrD-helicase domain-containing protein [Solirubrobacterales bacterium]|nr:UvrD-helicase domain-containing protein [Solirubrobacterales bacterium]